MQTLSKALRALLFYILTCPAQADGIINGGSGGGGGAGTVTSIAGGCASVANPNPITTTGTIAAGKAVNLQTGNNYPFANSDCGKLVQLNNAANQVPTIAAAGGGGSFAATWFADVCNIGAGTQTITPTTSQIGGAINYVIPAGTAAAPQCIQIVSDGANYNVIKSQAASSTITAGTTATSGITSTHLISSTGNLVADSGIVVSNVSLLNANNTFSGATNTYQGTLQTSAGNNIIAGGFLQSSGNTYVGSVLNFNSAGVNSIISSPVNGTLQFGAADIAAPVATKFVVQNVVASTLNTAGVDFTVSGSQGTGTGIGGNIILSTAPAGTTGTAQNAEVQGFILDSNSHLRVGARTAPSLGATCAQGGGSASIVGTDQAGLITAGTLATSCTLTFNIPYTSAPFCTVTWQGTVPATPTYAVTNTAITITQAGTTGDKINYICLAQNGG